MQPLKVVYSFGSVICQASHLQLRLNVLELSKGIGRPSLYEVRKPSRSPELIGNTIGLFSKTLCCSLDRKNAFQNLPRQNDDRPAVRSVEDRHFHTVFMIGSGDDYLVKCPLIASRISTSFRKGVHIASSIFIGSPEREVTSSSRHQ